MRGRVVKGPFERGGMDLPFITPALLRIWMDGECLDEAGVLGFLSYEVNEEEGTMLDG